MAMDLEALLDRYRPEVDRALAIFSRVVSSFEEPAVAAGASVSEADA